jgi:hypothetical protein
MAKGQITERILETIADFIEGSGDFVGALLEAGYGASAYRVNQIRDRKENERIDRARKNGQDGDARQRLSKMLCKLERDGLIEKNEHGRAALTLKGKKKLFLLRKKLKAHQLPDPRGYATRNTQTTTVVVFDIPETERRKRMWVRAVLMRLGYTMAQKSVWMGRGAIPVAFVRDLADQRIDAYVQIFAVTKKGTLRRIA